MDLQEDLRARLKTASLAAASVIVSLLLYLGVVEFVRARLRPFRGFLAVADVQLLRYAVFAMAVLAVVLLRVLRPAWLRKKAGEDAKTALHRVERTSLLTLFLAEVPGLLGLVLFFVAGLNVDFYILVFVSLALVFIYFPRRAAFEEWLS
jgi:hypothetical protein